MKNPNIFLSHILESITEIEKYTKGFSEIEFYRTTQVQDAVMRRLAVIGEAVKNLSKSFKDNHPTIPWKQIAGMRDVLIHDYFGVDLELVWRVVKNDLPHFKKEIEVFFDESNL